MKRREDDVKAFIGLIPKNIPTGRVLVTLDELMNKNFMKKHTKFKTVDDFWDRSPFAEQALIDIGAIDQEQLNAYVFAHTEFDTWDEMRIVAATKYFQKLK
ncbi:hypothetical protein DRW41_22045 [Neobacillus piezotolerans]|uniref:Uncharacterized protein n=1 Tax=Neobacillus piezotolerans TaxID=2259171 RepID=A0A3D8GKC7_9BACI|nr:hypothetical protein [Neobacillus piezotolerans]RDU34709.1 hypothetical protein DRW41_22045 [Neobacillus piezotolerans]